MNCKRLWSAAFADTAKINYFNLDTICSTTHTLQPKGGGEADWRWVQEEAHPVLDAYKLLN